MSAELTIYENPEAAEAMSLAAEYRAQGYDPSEALSMGWQEARGYDNPLEEMLVEAPNPPRRRSTKKAEEGGVSLLLLVVAGIVVHRLATGKWIWETIQLALQQKKLARQRAIEAAKKNGLEGVLNPWRVQGTGTVINLPPYNGNESIQLITP